MAMVRDNFWLDGEDARSHGIVCQKEIEFETAEPVVETVKVPGKSGAIIYYDGSYGNVTGLASCYVLGDRAAFRLTDINAWLLSRTGYRRLQTMHEPEFYRLARIMHGAKLDPRLNLLNAFEIEFDCVPYKYYLDGEQEISMTASTELISPSSFDSLPLITVHGSGAGSVIVNGQTISLTDSDDVVLDSENKKAYRGTTNMSVTVSGAFPVFGKANSVSFSGGVTGLTVIPRWRTI